MDKLEQERSQLKMDNDRLEQRVRMEKIVGSFPQFFFFFILFAFESAYIRLLAIGQWPNSFDFLAPAGANLFLCDRYFKTRLTTIDTNSSISFNWPTLPQTLLIAAHRSRPHSRSGNDRKIQSPHRVQ